MNETRSHEHSVKLSAGAERVFDALISPAAICRWWQASSAIVIPKPGGIWAGTWGDTEDPDYITIFRMTTFERPKRIVFDEAEYIAKAGPPPFELKTVTTFEIEPISENKCILKVIQTGFPAESVADEFYAACETGWKDTFDGMKNYIDALNS
ncbi:MAG: SRPBCC domain-containing protein [Pyrinomonadaceae bacterium]|nr:SRPBCC domain-containing protein [Pyrinomonadaceae bacterium]